MIYDANGKPVRSGKLDSLFWLYLVFAVFCACWTWAAHGQTLQLSPGPVKLTTLPVISPDSLRAVYLDAQGVWSVPVAGGAPVRLSAALTTGQSAKFAISPDSQRVVYQTDQDTRGVPEIYSVPIGGGASVKLNKSLTAANGRVRDFIISPTSQRVYYAADADLFTVLELWSVPITGGASTQLNKSFAVNYDVFEHYAASPSDRVVYRVGRTVQGGHELWSVAGTGTSAQARRISISPMVTGGGVDSDFQLSGERVVYRADAIDNGREDLYSVPVTGGTSTRLNFNDPRSVREFVIEGEFVYYAYSNAEWWRVPVVGGASVLTSEPEPLPVQSPDGVWIVFHIGSELWSDGPGGVQRRVSCAGQVVQHTFLAKPTYSVSGDSSTVAYVGNGALWSGPISSAVCEIFRDGFESGNQGAWQ